MSLHGGTVDEDLGWWSASAGQCVKETDPNALGGPADIAIVESLARSVFRRCIDPTPTGLEDDVDDPAGHPVVVNTRLAAGVRWKKRFQPPKLLNCQPEMVAIHYGLLSENRESQRQSKGNPFYGSGP